MRRPISLRLALMFAAAGAAVFVVSGFLLQFALREALTHQVREELSLRVSLVETLLVKATTPEHWAERIKPKLDAMDVARSGAHVWVVSDDARFRYGDQIPGVTRLAAKPGFGWIAIAGHDCDLLTLTHTIEATGDRPALQLVMAKDPAMFWQTLEAFRVSLAGIAIVGSALVAALGLWIARVGLRPINTLSRQAQALNPNQPSQRLEADGVPKELEDLSVSFNGALARLERSYKQLEAFNADVAHELRTPLMNLIGQTQVALSRPRKAADFEETLQSNLEELERLRAIVNDMLFLARADQGATTRDRHEVRLASEVRRVADFLESLIEDKQVVLRIEGDIHECIESALFRRAVSNLLTNAIEHSRPGDEIVVTIGREQGASCVSVSNPGHPIDDRHLGHLFDRFYRVDASRQNSAGNHGLGLAIVKAIATMHRGTVFVRSDRGVNTFGFTVAS